MGWNEPGGGNRDPWSGSGRDQRPPDLGALVNKAREQLRRLIGGRQRPGGAKGAGAIGAAAIAGILVAVWLLSGLYVIDEGRRGVVLTLGRHTATVGPGVHWHWPFPLQRVLRVDVDSRRLTTVGGDGGNHGLVLTKDLNLVHAQIAVRWRVADPARFLFRLQDPERAIRELGDGALRQALGQVPMAALFGQDLAPLERQIGEIVAEGLARYDAGIRLDGVSIQNVRAPEPVLAALADVERAREEARRLIDEAKTYREGVVPEANAQATRIREEAEAYRAHVVARAEGEVAGFLAIYEEYRKAPQLTRERMYIETMEAVLERSSKALVDVQGGQPVVYLPLEKMMRSADADAEQGRVVSPPSEQTAESGRAAAAPSRDRERSREVR